MRMISQNMLEKLRKEYPEGCRVDLVYMDDPYAKLDFGDRCTVRCVDDMGTIHVNWDCGSSLGIVYGVDSCRKVVE